MNERLVVEPLGWSSHYGEDVYLTGLIDKDGQTRLLWVSNSWAELLTLCRDAETGTDHAKFSRWSGGTAASEIFHMAYDAASGALVKYEMLEGEKRGMGSFACR